MKTRYSIFAVLAAFLLVSQTAFSQEKIQPQEDDALEADLRTGLSATVIWKLPANFSLDAGYTLLTTDNVSRIFRNQVSIGVSYSPCKPLRVGTGYAYMAQYSSSGKLRPRHRAFIFAEGTLRAGEWKFSLYEKFQFTNRAYDNDPYKNPKNSLDLKSRLKAAYAGDEHIEPYAFVEVWNSFNDAAYSADYDPVTQIYSNTSFLGYTDAYVTRVRTALGLKWKISSHHSIDFSYMFDLSSNKDIDYDSILENLESYKWDKKLVSNLSIGYVFAF